ncbi:methyltransferase domain-containing protein [Blastomonas sp.]|uniref:methyltransferase domain-containing protein n=1 Tax=Blastomonas sp. TaxID=1909299 RepID=UPI00263302E1|nr:methyltransferase domain-containing protein [Blastomonas sp.]MDM7955963.1 methyltransferase domain-containing protein [Blastomonas sp.]
MMTSLVRRLKGRSPAEIVRLVAHNIAYHAREMTPRARARDRQFQAFDQTWGTDTFAIRELHTLEVDPSVAAHARRYQSSNGADMPVWFAELGVDFGRTVFIDYGCGKGRALLEAARFGFHRVIGVEFAPELAKIALANRDIVQAKGGLVAPIEVVCMDARKYVPPNDVPLLCYFYDPFDDAVMAPVAERLCALTQPVTIIYLEPNCADQFRRRGGWSESRSAGTLVLRNAAALAA